MSLCVFKKKENNDIIKSSCKSVDHKKDRVYSERLISKGYCKKRLISFYKCSQEIKAWLPKDLSKFDSEIKRF